MTFAEIKSDVFQRLREAEVSPAFFTEADVEEAINDGYIDISDFTEWYERNVTFNLLSHRTYYDLRTMTTDIVLTPGRCWNAQNNVWLEPTSVRELDRRTAYQWEKNKAEPQSMFIRGLYQFGVYPKQNADSGTCTLYYTALPAALSSDSDTPGFDEDFHPVLVYYACFELMAEYREVKTGLKLFWPEYERLAQKLKAVVDGRPSRDHAGAIL